MRDRAMSMEKLDSTAKEKRGKTKLWIEERKSGTYMLNIFELKRYTVREQLIVAMRVSNSNY